MELKTCKRTKYRSNDDIPVGKYTGIIFDPDSGIYSPDDKYAKLYDNNNSNHQAWYNQREPGEKKIIDAITKCQGTNENPKSTQEVSSDPKFKDAIKLSMPQVEGSIQKDISYEHLASLVIKSFELSVPTGIPEYNIKDNIDPALWVNLAQDFLIDSLVTGVTEIVYREVMLDSVMRYYKNPKSYDGLLAKLKGVENLDSVQPFGVGGKLPYPIMNMIISKAVPETFRDSAASIKIYDDVTKCANGSINFNDFGSINRTE